MKSKGLKLDNIPPFEVPLRFFLLAPWMGCMAGLVLLVSMFGSTAYLSQWSPSLLSATHLITLGFIAMTMYGALFQVLPVITGHQIPGTSGPLPLVLLVCWAIGVLVLTWCFYHSNYELILLALGLLSLSILIFLISLSRLLLRPIPGGVSLISIRLAGVSLIIAIIFGVIQVSYNMGLELSEGVLSFDKSGLKLTHVLWGVGGWVLLLVIGVSYQVIPMFHVTPNYPKQLTRFLSPVIFLLTLTVSVFSGIQITPLLIALLMLSWAVYATTSLYLLSKRRRKIGDATVNFWRLGFSSILLLIMVVLLKAASDQGYLHLQSLGEPFILLIGNLAILGFTCSVIIGMLHKIVPFLAYMHLQRACQGNYELILKLPNMNMIIPKLRGRVQWMIHLVMLISAALASFFSEVSGLVGVCLILDFAWLGQSLFTALMVYRQSLKEIELTRMELKKTDLKKSEQTALADNLE